MSGRVLYVMGCAAPPVLQIGSMVTQARARGWDTCLVLSPTAAAWLADDLSALTRMSGHPVYSQFRRPGAPEPLPRPDAILIAPITANTINKWAAGINDTVVLGLITVATRTGLPAVAVPCIRGDHAHPAFGPSVELLRTCGVDILLDEALEPPGDVPTWKLGLDRLATLADPMRQPVDQDRARNPAG